MRFGAHKYIKLVESNGCHKRAGIDLVMEMQKRSEKKRRGRSCVDLFSGAGGLAVGFRKAGWNILAANDIDEDAALTFRQNFPETTFFLGPIAKLKAKDLLAECNINKGELDCLIGGPPCQSFSYNNHQRSANDARARLFEDYLRLVRELAPKTLIMENVPGILTIDNGSVVRVIASKLSRLGYAVSVKLLSAEQFGAPQIRRRAFIVATRVGDSNELLPIPSHGISRDTSEENRAYINKHDRKTPSRKKLVTIQQAIGDLPRLENGGGKHVRKMPSKRPTTQYQRNARKGATALYNHVCRNLSEVMLERMKYVPEGGNWRDIPRRLLTEGMKRARSSDHTKRYGRLSRKGLSATLLTKCDPHWGAYVHPTQNRTISVREAARIQGFPDEFQFAGESISKQYAQVGNAVPIPLAQALGEAALKHLRRSERKQRSATFIRSSVVTKRKRAA